MYFVYIVRCKDNSLYFGQTTDIKRRLYEHNSGTKQSAKYTRGRQPVRLVHIEKWRTLSQACKREAQIKKLSKAKKETLVSENYSSRTVNTVSGAKP